MYPPLDPSTIRVICQDRSQLSSELKELLAGSCTRAGKRLNTAKDSQAVATVDHWMDSKGRQSATWLGLCPAKKISDIRTTGIRNSQIILKQASSIFIGPELVARWLQPILHYTTLPQIVWFES